MSIQEVLLVKCDFKKGKSKENERTFTQYPLKFRKVFSKRNIYTTRLSKTVQPFRYIERYFCLYLCLHRVEIVKVPLLKELFRKTFSAYAIIKHRTDYVAVLITYFRKRCHGWNSAYCCISWQPNQTPRKYFFLFIQLNMRYLHDRSRNQPWSSFVT